MAEGIPNPNVIRSLTFKRVLITVTVFLISAILFVTTDKSPGAFSEFLATIAFIGIGISFLMSLAGFFISVVIVFSYSTRMIRSLV
ncbi:MAG: hypothetical protein H0W62_03585 [Chitinophagales bacterium]|nr:hypothetical protein [Chitinophagales bacterium]